MIKVQNPSKIFPDGTRAVDDVGLSIQDGEFIAVIGLSDAGKSTFVRCLNCLNDPCGLLMRRLEGMLLCGPEHGQFS
jgi:phosphonate transport system ATP-binding protein